MNCAEALVDFLEKRGTPFVTGIPGGTNLPLYDALYKSGIRHILARHEQGAGFIAQGYARISGRAGVVFATSGPGALNLVSAIGDAFMDSIPLVAVTGQVPRAMAGSDAFQEADTTGVVASLTKHCYCLNDPSALGDVLREAFELAETGRPGPVLIDIPKDVQLAECAPESVCSGGILPAKRLTSFASPPSHEDLDTALSMIENAARPLIIAGGGIRTPEAARAIAELSMKNGIPLAATLMAPFIDTPYNVGMPGMHGFADTQHIVESADLIIAAGIRFDDRMTGNAAAFAPKAKVIHIDIDQSEHGKIREQGLFVAADAGQFAGLLCERISANSREEWMDHISRIRGKYPRPQPSAGHPAEFVRQIGRHIPEGSIIVTDVGQHQMWAAQYIDRSRISAFLTSGGMGTMGFGLPAAIGAALASPDKKTVLISGDGSILMNLQELVTAAELGLNLSIVILNNASLGLVRQQQRLFYESRYSASTLSDCNFAKVAEAFGIESVRTSIDDADIGALCREGLVCADIITSAEYHVLPMVAPGAANICMIDAQGAREQ